METSEKNRNEAKTYEPIKATLEKLLTQKFGGCHLEITARGNFSNKLKEKVPQGRDLIFSFLDKDKPDLTGFIEEGTTYKSTEFVVAEIKDEKIHLADVYQIRRYADLFHAKYAFLISTKPLPHEIIRLQRIISTLFNCGWGYEKIILAQFDAKQNVFVEWHEKNPFEESK